MPDPQGLLNPVGKAALLAAELRRLHAAAGTPEYRILGRQAAAQQPPVRLANSTVSDWLTGKTIPAQSRAFNFLVSHLLSRPGIRDDPHYRQRPLTWWQRLRAEARAERRTGGSRGGRPTAAPPTAPPPSHAVASPGTGGGSSIAMSGQAEAVVMAGSITGDVHVHPPASAPAFDTQVRGRCLVGVIPQPAGCFQDRQATAELDALETTDIGSALRGVVLTGTGGVGKTQLAADYARRQWTTGRVEVLVWVTAATTTEIIEAYADAALAFAAAGMGVAVVPAAVKRIDLPDITYRQLTITSGPELLIISRTDELSGPVKAFLSHARKSEPRPPLET